ncbi:YeeE/YedE family protein [Mangrovicoccus ximenensis]|uniref:YeeE/YedE family protein n=1 Tax=Mangrovicoccus ximenensis TaxID=1911570 RepID=UPI000D3DC031|nr:YeeE/YedE family protein [Mangrovicoccus ximenensis]
MKRLVFSAASGGLFGLGLMISGMTNPAKVQGWLDFLGDWDPTLAFVLGGAIVPMFFAWRHAEGRKPLLGGSFPAKPSQVIDRNLILGSCLFGAGWGLAGLCPGPAMASIGYGNPGIWVFVIAMIAGMAVTPWARRRLDATPAKG